MSNLVNKSSIVIVVTVVVISVDITGTAGRVVAFSPSLWNLATATRTTMTALAGVSRSVIIWVTLTRRSLVAVNFRTACRVA